MSRRVALLMGGTSVEREVSLVTGRACADALRAHGYEVLVIEVGRDVAAVVAALTPSAARNHGRRPQGRRPAAAPRAPSR